MIVTCARYLDTGAHMSPDEFVTDKRCSITNPHENHYWSTKEHQHIDIMWSCIRYCEGVQE